MNILCFMFRESKIEIKNYPKISHLPACNKYIANLRGILLVNSQYDKKMKKKDYFTISIYICSYSIVSNCSWILVFQSVIISIRSIHLYNQDYALQCFFTQTKV